MQSSLLPLQARNRKPSTDARLAPCFAFILADFSLESSKPDSRCPAILLTMWRLRWKLKLVQIFSGIPQWITFDCPGVEISPIANRTPPDTLRYAYRPSTPTEIVINSLGAFAVGKKRTERDLLCLMILFHTHKIAFRRPIFPDRPCVLELAALTRNHVAEIAADAWPKRSDTERTNSPYWHHLFSVSGEFEVMEDVRPDLRDTVLELRARLLEHPDIASVEIED